MCSMRNGKEVRFDVCLSGHSVQLALIMKALDMNKLRHSWSGVEGAFLLFSRWFVTIYVKEKENPGHRNLLFEMPNCLLFRKALPNADAQQSHIPRVYVQFCAVS